MTPKKTSVADREAAVDPTPIGSAPSDEEPAPSLGSCDRSEAAGQCFIIGIGASAGGQEALEQLFTTMPPDCDLTFVVITHLHAEGPSFLAEILSRFTPMEVVTATEGMLLQPDRIHVIPPGRELTVSGGRLHLEEPGEGKVPHPIDRFFKSLAEDAGERAMAVVLSGFGMDGGEGVKAIKKGGGVVLVQDPDSAVNPAMPKNVLAAEVADLVLPADEMAAKIAELARGACHLPPRTCLPRSLDEDLQVVFTVVKEKTGHDFSSYKRNTVVRRLERRMAVNEVHGIGKYIALLQGSDQEAHALGREILIGVTSFFRDPEAFQSLRQEIFPRLFADRGPDNPVRIWHACCATGEEVYSMAILIREYLSERGQEVPVRFFASDIDEAAIAQARAGLYPADIEEEVGKERLAAHFTLTDGRYQVAKSLREMVVFAHHSLIKDPPFSRLDLLVCRNFLIYLNPDMQERLVALFHQVLKPGGCLFLGGAESVGRHSELFAPIDKKWKIFQRRESRRRGDTPFPFLAPTLRSSGAGRPPRPQGDGEPGPGPALEKRLLERYVPPCVVVNEKYEIVHVFGQVNRFLRFPAGEPTRDLLKLAREELRPALRAAIYKAFAEQEAIVFHGVKLSGDDEGEAVNVDVEPVDRSAPAGRLAMVVFEAAPVPTEVSPWFGGRETSPGDEASKEVLIRQLEEQLSLTHEQLQATMEQLETSNEGFTSTNEELMSINEEYQSANEELQSTNEELETSKEELQALNEELVTVNAELQGKVEELNRANNDMENLFHSSKIATIFLDPQLTIQRFTPAAAALFNLIPADIGRSFRRLAGAIDWPTLTQDAETVLAGQPFAEREVTALERGHTFLKRVFPYRNPEGKIEGLVVTFIDITERKRAEGALRESEERLRLFIEHAPAALAMFDREMRYLSVSRRWRSDYALGERDLIGVCHYQVFSGIPPAWKEVHRRGLAGELLRAEAERFERADGTAQWLKWEIHPWYDAAGEVGGIVIFTEDITERKRAEEALKRAKEEWERTFDSVPDLIAIMDADHRIVRVNRAMAERLGATQQECVGQRCCHSVHGAEEPPGFCPHLLTLADGEEHQAEVHEERLGGDFLVTTTPLLDETGNMIGTVHVARDITERKRAEQMHAQLAAIVESTDDAVVSKNLEGTILSWNAGAERLFGYRAEEVLGRPITLLLPPDRKGEEENILQRLAAGQRVEHFETVRLAKDGRPLAVSVTSSPLRDGAGRIVGASKIVRDISERKQAEEALLASHRRQNLLAETAGRLLASDAPQEVVETLCRKVMEYLDCHAFFNFLVDEERGRLHLNAYAGIPEEDARQIEWLDYGVAVCGCAARDACRIVAEEIPTTPDPRTELVKSYGIQAYACHPLMAQGQVFGTLSFGTRSRTRFSEDDLALMKAVADQVALAMERRGTEEALRAAKDAAETAVQAKSRFLANMSHELRTPMTGVLGMLELALAGSLEPGQREFVGMAHQSARSLLRILNDILDLTKIEAGKVSLEEKPFLLRECTAGSVDILLPEAQRKGIALSCDVAEDLPPIMVGDQVRLRQVLTNLVGNAVKFTERGGVKVRLSAGAELSGGCREVVWEVVDTGIGIPEEKKHLLFRSFTQIDDSNTRRHGGTGLGLVISKEIVERMGGAIWFESREGEGSTFSFTVPLAVPELEQETESLADPTPISSAWKEQSFPPQAKPRLLIAEDDQIIRKVLAMLFRQSGYELDLAENGREAVRMWEEGSYQLVFMDVQMPLLDGFEATRAIREKERNNGGHTPIIAMTAHALKEDQERCFAAGMDHYIAKPIDFDQCRKMIETILQEGGAQPKQNGGSSKG